MRSSLRWQIVGILCAVGFVLYVDRVNIAVAAPQIGLDFGFSRGAMGKVLSAFLFGYSIGLVPGGWLADRFGPYRVLTMAGLAWAAATVAIGCIPGGSPGEGIVWIFVLVRFCLGLCEACAYPTFNRAVANWMLPGERARAMGLINGISSLGASCTPLLIAWLIGRFGWRQAFFVSAGLTLVVTAWWQRRAASEPRRHPRIREEELRLITTSHGPARVESPDRAWYGRLLRSRGAYALCLSEVFFGLAIFVYITWFYTYFVEVRHAGPMYAAMLSSLPYVAMAIGAPVGGVLSDGAVRRWGAPWGRRIVPIAALLLSGVCGIVAPRIENNAAAAIVFSSAAGFQYVSAGPYWAAVIDLTRRGAGLLGGAMNGSGNLGQAVGTITFPWIVARIGWQTGLQLAGVSALISALVWLLFDSSRTIDEEGGVRVTHADPG